MHYGLIRICGMECIVAWDVLWYDVHGGLNAFVVCDVLWYDVHCGLNALWYVECIVD